MSEPTPTDELAAIRSRLLDYYKTYDHDERTVWLAETLPLIQVVDMICIDAHNYDVMGESAGLDAERAIQRAAKAESDLESAVQPLAPEMERLNKNLSDANEKALLAQFTLAAQRTALLALFDEAERTGSQGIAVRGREIIG